MSSPRIIFGSAAFGNAPSVYAEESEINGALDILEQYGVKVLDTAQLYGNAEAYIGKVKAGSRFTVDSKVGGGFIPGSATKEGVIKAGKEGREKTGVEKLDIYYIHAPDASIPIGETLAGIQELYESGHFTRFGLSNFSPEDVRAVYDHAKAHNYVLPSVYQGNYNAVARLPETELLPTLRELGIAYYAYSPIAGGFLTKTAQEVRDGKGRFDPNTPLGKMYLELYSRPSYLEALSKWGDVAAEVGTSRANLAYRWVAYHSAVDVGKGDAVIIGARNNEQLKETLEGLKDGPLPEKAIKTIDEIWEGIKHEAPRDNYTVFQKLMK